MTIGDYVKVISDRYFIAFLKDDVNRNGFYKFGIGKTCKVGTIGKIVGNLSDDYLILEIPNQHVVVRREGLKLERR